MMKDSFEAIRQEWRGGGLKRCIEGTDKFLPSIPANRVVPWTCEDEPDLIRTTMDQVDWAVAKTVGISVQMLHATRRSKDVSIPRFLAMYLMSIYCPRRSLVVIGRHFNMDHTSIIHGIRRAKKLLSQDPDFAADHERASRTLQGMI